MAGNSYLDSLWNKVKQYAPTRHGVNSAGEAILHAPFDAAGAVGDVMASPQFRLVHALLTGNGQELTSQLVQHLNPINALKPQNHPVSAAVNKVHDVIHKDTAAPTTPVEKYVTAGIRGGPGGIASQAASDAIPEGKWYKPAAVNVAGIVTNLAVPLAISKLGGVPEELTTGTDLVPSKGPAGPADGSAPVGSFGSQREAAQYMADNKLGGSHEIVAHGDGSYSAVPREGTLSTPADVPETPQAPPVEAETPSATQPTPAPQEAPQPPSDEQQQATQLTTAEPTAPLAPDGLPGNGSVRPIDPAMMARIMNDPGAIGQAPITTPAPEGDNTPVAPSITTSEEAPAPAPQQIPQGYEPPAPAPVSNAGTFQEVSTTPDGTKTIHYTASNGETIPIKMGIEPDGTAEMAIDQFGSRVNQFGPSEIRQAMKGLMEQYPEIKRFGGFRRSGAGAGRVQEITPSTVPTPTAEPTPLSPAQLRERSRQEVAGKVTYLPDKIRAAEEANLPDRVNKTPYEQGVEDRFHEVLPHWAEANNLTHEQTASYLANLPKDHPFVTHFTDLMNQRPITPRDPNEGRVNGPVLGDQDGQKPFVDHLLDVASTHTIAPEKPNTPVNDKTGIEAAKNFVKNIAADQRGSLGYKDDDLEPNAGDPTVQKMIDALHEMAPLRKETGKQISKVRSERIAQAMKAMYANEGFASLHAAKGALKGEMPKAIFPSISDGFSPEEETHLVNLVKHSNRVSGYQQITVLNALEKVLGKEYGEVPTEGELKLLKEVFPKDLIDAIEGHTLLEKVAGHATNILGIPRAVKTIGDLGVAFRQCSPLIGTKEFWKSFPSMFKGIASENLYHATFEAIKQMDTYPQMVEGKVAFTNMDSKLSEREEFAASKIAEHIPGVRQSERGFTGYLNTVRALTFDRLYKKAVASGANVDDPEVLKEIGNFVNILSGRGSIGEIGDKASPFLAAAFFSPRLQWSRLQLLTMPFNPKFYRMPGYLQKEYMRSVISYGLYMAFTLGVLQHVFGAKVSNDPRSTDYGRAVIGKTRFDVSGSFQPYVRTVAQIATGQKVTATGKTEDLGKGFGVPTRLDTVVSFAESKASPNVDVILNELRGKDWEHPKSITGQEMDWKDPSMNNPAVDALIPMGLEAMMKAGDVYGYKSPLPYVAGAAETGGITANTYADQKAHGHRGFKGFGSGSGFGKSFKGFK